MKDAQRGDFLDFSKILHLSPLAQKRTDVSPPKNRLDDLRARFRDARPKRVRLPLNPMPRFDDVYEGGMAHMDEGENYRLPVGDLELSDQAKEYLRDQGDSL